MASENCTNPKIRELLICALNPSDFDQMVFDCFRPVNGHFSDGMDHNTKITRLIDYCERHGETDRLLLEIKKKNPYQYDRIFSPPEETSATITTSIKINEEVETNIQIFEQGVVRITLKCQYSVMTPEKIKETVNTIAAALKISSDLIQVKSVDIESKE